jgi:hypothetical protein
VRSRFLVSRSPTSLSVGSASRTVWTVSTTFVLARTGEPVVGNAASDPARGATTRRLLDLQAQGLLSTQDVHVAPEGLGVSERTVLRWLRQGQDGQDLTHRSRVRLRSPMNCVPSWRSGGETWPPSTASSSPKRRPVVQPHPRARPSSGLARDLLARGSGGPGQRRACPAPTMCSSNGHPPATRRGRPTTSRYRSSATWSNHG